MNVIFLGPPGSGKGTHAEQASRALGIPRLSTGDMLRGHIKNGTPLGTEAKGYIEAGQLVPDALVIQMLKERLQAPDCANGVIYDGFPRTLPQAQALDAITAIDRVLNLSIADEAIVNRMKGRRVCAACGFTSHIKLIGERTDCPECGGTLTVRKDDAPETVLSRLAVYHAQTKPLIQYYQSRGILVTVNSDGPIAQVQERVDEALR